MNRTFHPFRAPAWSGFKRYFVEWRNRALIRRESIGNLGRSIIPPAPPARDV
jgi:hypothetical protein